MRSGSASSAASRPRRPLVRLDGRQFQVIGVRRRPILRRRRRALVRRRVATLRRAAGARAASACASGRTAWWLAVDWPAEAGLSRASKPPRICRPISPGDLSRHYAAHVRPEGTKLYQAHQADCLSARHGVSPLRGAVRDAALDPARDHRPGAADRLREPRQPDACPGDGARARNRRAPRHRRLARRIVRQLLSESLLLAGSAPPAAPCSRVVQPLPRRLSQHHGQPLFVDLRPDWRVFGFHGARAVTACLLFGLAPGDPRHARFARVGDESGQPRRTAGPRALRPAPRLVVLQVALSLVLAGRRAAVRPHIAEPHGARSRLPPGWRTGRRASTSGGEAIRRSAVRDQPRRAEPSLRPARRGRGRAIVTTPVSGSGWNENVRRRPGQLGLVNSYFNRVAPGTSARWPRRWSPAATSTTVTRLPPRKLPL